MPGQLGAGLPVHGAGEPEQDGWVVEPVAGSWDSALLLLLACLVLQAAAGGSRAGQDT